MWNYQRVILSLCHTKVVCTQEWPSFCGFLWTCWTPHLPKIHKALLETWFVMCKFNLMVLECNMRNTHEIYKNRMFSEILRHRDVHPMPLMGFAVWDLLGIFSGFTIAFESVGLPFDHCDQWTSTPQPSDISPISSSHFLGKTADLKNWLIGIPWYPYDRLQESPNINKPGS